MNCQVTYRAIRFPDDLPLGQTIDVFQLSDDIRPSPFSKRQKDEMFLQSFMVHRVFRSTDATQQRNVEDDRILCSQATASASDSRIGRGCKPSSARLRDESKCMVRFASRTPVKVAFGARPVNDRR